MRSSHLLIAVHGWLLSRQVWAPFATTWRRHHPEIDLWCPDLPGFGDAPRPVGLLPNLSAYGRWLANEAVLQARGRPFVLLGHSLGQVVPLLLAVVVHDEVLARGLRKPSDQASVPLQRRAFAEEYALDALAHRIHPSQGLRARLHLPSVSVDRQPELFARRMPRTPLRRRREHGLSLVAPALLLRRRKFFLPT